jgi:hypothetical protein
VTPPVLDVLRSNDVTDVTMMVGCAHDSGPPQWDDEIWTLSNTYYLALDNGFLRMDSAVNDGQVALRHVPAMSTEEFDGDVDTHHTRRLSLETILLGYAFPARCTRVRYMLDGDSSEALGVVSAVEFTFGDHPRPLFFGAMNTYGLQPGTWGAYDRHVDFWRPRLPGVTEHVWTA